MYGASGARDRFPDPDPANPSIHAVSERIADLPRCHNRRREALGLPSTDVAFGDGSSSRSVRWRRRVRRRRSIRACVVPRAAQAHRWQGLTANELIFFDAGRDDFAEAEGVGDGLGPRFNLDSCGGCHLQPDIGGTSPSVNPAGRRGHGVRFAEHGAVVHHAERADPEARFKFAPGGAPDGGVHGLFVITGRNDSTGSASGCNIVQENFAAQVAANNVIFPHSHSCVRSRPDRGDCGSGAADQFVCELVRVKAARGINGRFNRNGNDGRITRFGWKAQNPSGLVFSGEAYNVEMGITNEAFQTERDETPECQFARLPNDVTNIGWRDWHRYGERGREVRVLHALPRSADAIHDGAGRRELDYRGA